MVEEKTINEIAKEWEDDKRKYVKKSTIAAYQLLIQNHISPYFGELNKVCEEDVQKFVLKKLDDGLSEKTIKRYNYCFKNDFKIWCEIRIFRVCSNRC